MICHTLLRDEGILLVSPKEPLEANDFEELAGEVDSYIDEKGALQGLMVMAKRFPGWRNFAGLKSHFRFVRDHRTKVKKIAAVTDSMLLSLFPRLVAPFIRPKVKRFHYADRESALAWLRAN
jgi:hypothetical protein